MMTMKAQELGMTHTHFVNANGLPDSRQITSAHDIAILCRAVLRDYPQYYHYFGTEEFTYRGRSWNNHNHLLGHMPGVDGFKTGFTNAAGFNLAASAVRDGRRLIAVVMGGSSGAARNANVEDLLLTGFDVEERRARGETDHRGAEPVRAAAGRGPRSCRRSARAMRADPIDMVLTAAEHGSPVTFAARAASPSWPPSARASRPNCRATTATSPDPPPALRRPRPPARATGRSRSASTAPASSPPARSTTWPTPSRRCSTTARARSTGSARSYRAVFTGFTEAEARSACSAVAASEIGCSASAARSALSAAFSIAAPAPR